MQILLAFGRRYPVRTAVMMVSLALAATAEGVGLSSLLPLLGILTGGGGNDSALERMVSRVLATFGVEPTIGVLLGLIIFGALAKAALVLVAQVQVGYTVARVATDLRMELLQAVLQARWLYYVRQPVGLLANSFATEAARAADAYLYGATMAAQTIETILYATVAALVSWQTAVAAALVGATTVVLLSGLVRKTKRAGRRQTELLRTVLARMADVLYAVKPLKAMGREPLIAPLLEHQTEKLNRALRRQVLSKEAVRALQEPLLVVSLAGGLYVSVQYWKLAVDSVLVLALVFARSLFCLNKVQKSYQAMSASESAYWSIQRTIDESRTEAEQCEGTGQPGFTREVALRGVTFAYGDREILGDVSLSIPSGQVTAIIGPSGAGKTTIADLALGLVRPQRGQVLLDDVPLDEIDIAAWRRMVGYVPQETLLLHENVRVNITLGDPDLSDDDVNEALRAAGAWEFVSQLPEGLDTALGERGARVSGGQRQRIAIARAIVHRPRLLILDEATAALDPASEADIYATVRALRGRTTILAISHQPGLLAVSDRVYRLDLGRVEAVDATHAAHASRAAADGAAARR